MRALAVDLGGSHATCALVEDRSLVSCETIALECREGLECALPAIEDAFRRVLDHTGVDSRLCAGLAFSFCGLVDTARGSVIGTNGKYSDASHLNLAEWCERTFGIPLRMENDARMALLGEWYAGSAQGCDDVVMVTLGTGIGGAAMMGGRLIRGRHFQAGCLGGHLPAAYNGRPCTCGAVGCVEAEASTWSLPEICRSMPGFEASQLAAEERITFEVLLRHAAAHDAVAESVREHCLMVWGCGAVGLIHAYDPELLIYGGGVMKSADVVLPFLQEYVSQHAWTPWGKVSVRRAQLGDTAALLGAVPLLSAEAA